MDGGRNVCEQKTTRREGEKAEMMIYAEKHKTQNDYFMGEHFDQIALFSLNCAGVDVPCGHSWEVRQCRRNVVARGRTGKEEEKGQNLKNVPVQKPRGVNILVFSEPLW